MLFLRAVSVALIVIGSSLLASAQQPPLNDSVIVEQLISKSPWKGAYTSIRSAGALEIVFSKPDKELLGLIQNYATNSYFNLNGPVRFLSVKNGLVEFETSDATFALRIDSSGKLAGNLTSKRFRSNPLPVVVLSPSQ